MRVTGINGESGPLWGLVDSGADRTSLPLGYATLMGYGVEDLTMETGTGANGEFTMHVASRASTAVVPEIPQHVVEFAPIFLPGARTVLWGRRDFMRRFTVSIMESSQHFAITPV
ncbi:hypothetical protein [Conexibacter sp. S30A1]|uniref:hypothetical protein n=1 Tax=Conexibacter sp. S30A1 TaxID=2937800 RepID=UPI00200D40C7|nr:hypothetical protein [Conexibacter sp. S30A1]